MKTFLWKPKVRKLQPIHWILFFIFFTLVLAWALTDTTSGIKYRHSVRHAQAADRKLNLDDSYRKQVQHIESYMKQFCNRGSDIIFGHNVIVNDIIFNDYIFHVCNGQTWLNAKISVNTEKQVMCQEEFANIYRSVPRAKSVTMKAIDVNSWTEREVTAEGKTSCIWQHAVDILDRKWVGL